MPQYIYQNPKTKQTIESKTKIEVAVLGCHETPEKSGWSWFPPSMFRVDGVIHSFNIGNKGYTTELLLMALA